MKTTSLFGVFHNTFGRGEQGNNNPNEDKQKYGDESSIRCFS